MGRIERQLRAECSYKIAELRSGLDVARAARLGIIGAAVLGELIALKFIGTRLSDVTPREPGPEGFIDFTLMVSAFFAPLVFGRHAVDDVNERIDALRSEKNSVLQEHRDYQRD